ncbi:deoxyhypusine synthase isoform X1 [Heptranchias perlo]|uniref:deoxyhypusine synthase isoform X1 n=1 Tax=Heptranchias perlo TaxID=212740 RepID=UPI0035594A55
MGTERMAESIPPVALNAVFKQSASIPEGSLQVKGYDFNRGIDYHALMQSYITTGYQATSFGQAVQQINAMIEKKLEPLDESVEDTINLNPCQRERSGCTIFLGYTSNLISSGIRETIRYLVQHNMVDCVVTTAGGIEEDFIKCLAPTFVGDFSLKGKELRSSGINRIGNLLVPNENYCKFEDWVMPILDQMVLEQNEQGMKWTPSKMIARLGKEIDNPESVYYWTYKNNIPVFSPALTDGSLGDMIYFHSYKTPGLVLDIVEDIRRINNQAVYAQRTGMIILGGGVVKHHIANANLMRNGADYSVYVNTGQEFDGSDSGAKPDEAVSWGKIRSDSKPVKICADATLVFPLLVAETFARKFSAFSPQSKMH